MSEEKEVYVSIFLHPSTIQSKIEMHIFSLQKKKKKKTK